MHAHEAFPESKVTDLAPIEPCLSKKASRSGISLGSKNRAKIGMQLGKSMFPLADIAHPRVLVSVTNSYLR